MDFQREMARTEQFYLRVRVARCHAPPDDFPAWAAPSSGESAQQPGPVAEQAADLLVNGDFSLVRECKHPDCTLWFYDLTKAHRRR